jgi:hypothetical protein
LAAIYRITEDDELRRTLAVAGPARAAHFSWRFTAQTTLEAPRALICENCLRVCASMIEERST